MGRTLQFTVSLFSGFLLGLLNLVLWRRWARNLLGQKKLSWAPFFARSLLKIGFLGITVWLLLTQHYLEPLGFLVGFSLVVVFLIIKGLRWN